METIAEDGPAASDAGYRIARRCAAVAGVFSLIVCALLLYDYSLRGSEKLLEDQPYLALKSLLATQPDNEDLAVAIREADVHRRQKHFRQRAFATSGAWLLLGGVVVFLVAAKSAATLRRKLPEPGPQTSPKDIETEWTALGRWSVAGLCVILIGVAVALMFALPAELPQSEEELAALEQPAVTDPGDGQSKPPEERQSPPPAEEPPSAEEIAKMWPGFRGPGGSGISAYDNAPIKWDGKSGEGILWKEAVPLPGLNSPVVWGKRVFLSGASKELQEVYCFDADTGKLLWQKEVTPDVPRSEELPDPDFTGYAAPTTATDGRYVFAIFGSGDLAAFDVVGNKLWSKSLGVPKNSYGHASSLISYGDLVLVQIDQGMAKNKESRLYGFAAATGGKSWEAVRDVSTSWTSPIIISHDGRDQVITCADPWVIAYDPADGTEIWRAKVMAGESGPSPVFASGVVYVGNEYCELSAIRVDGQGDVTETHVNWTCEDGLPDTCSPLVTDQFVFQMPSAAYFTCIDVKTGELLWDHSFDGMYTSSPGMAGGLIYLFGEVDSEDEVDEDGFALPTAKTWLVEPGREECKIVGELDLGEGCVTSPAFGDGRIYIRGKKHLFCIGGE